MSIHTKKQTKPGFTLIEVVLFLAISSAILMFILSGTTNSLAQQRYNDTVQDLYSFLSDQYSSVINTRNTSSGGGWSKRVIYGKLIVINNGIAVDAWTVTGDLVTTNTDNSKKDFKNLKLMAKCNERTSYTIQWGGKIETTEASHINMNATIAILRSPKNGTVYTYVNNNSALLESSTCTSDEKAFVTIHADGSSNFDGQFAQNELNLCIATEDNVYGGRRRNIRFRANSTSVNAVSLIPLDQKVGEDENKCK